MPYYSYDYDGIEARGKNKKKNKDSTDSGYSDSQYAPPGKLSYRINKQKYPLTTRIKNSGLQF